MSSDHSYLKLYIIVRYDLPAHIVPVLVAHTILNAHDLYHEKKITKHGKLSHLEKW